MSTKSRYWAGVCFVGALTIGAFCWGASLTPSGREGRDLFHSQARARLDRSVASSGNLILTAGRASGKRAADSAAPPALGTGSDPEAFSDDRPADTFQQVYLLLKRNYVDPLPTDTKLGHGAAAAMLASLQDPDSRFLEPDEMAEIEREAKGIYGGIGAVMDVRKIIHPKDTINDIPENTEYRLTVVTTLPGSPAEKAGLEEGDVISHINNHWIATSDPSLEQIKALKAAQSDPVAFNKIVAALQKKVDTALSISQAETLLDNGSGAAKPLTLKVARAGEAKPLTISVDTATQTVVTPVVAKTLPGDIGYIKINQFTAGADKTFASALAGLGPGLKGLIVDLRGSPGGLVDVGEAIAGTLTNAHALGVLQTQGKRESVLAVQPARAVACPVVALTDHGTANTAELLASTLQSQGDTVVGTTTYGDGSDVQPIKLRDGSGFTMTVGKLMTAARQNFAGVGIKPNIAVPEASGADAPLARAVGLLSGRMARIPSSRG